jgi:predicted Zn-ribbon and HTH transcriptional regulator
MDQDTQHLFPYSEYILKDLILACIELSEPHVGACALGIQHKLRQQTIICLTTAMDNNSINLTTDSQVAVQSMLLDNLQNHDEHIRQLSVAAMVAFLNRYLTEPESERETICIKTLLARANDEKKNVILALYTHLPSLAGVLSSQGLQLTREAVISQCGFFTTQRDIQLLVRCLTLLSDSKVNPYERL